MKDIDMKMIFIVSGILRFFACLMIMNLIWALITTVLFSAVYYLLRKYNVGYLVLVVGIDYLLISYCSMIKYGANAYSVYISLITFVMMNFIPYFILINKIGEETSYKALNRYSNEYVDKGIKALEKEDIDLAISEFENAIKRHKKNYLGYMGMCDALSKKDLKHLKKFKYYKKKCLKYAPEKLKENIVKKYK